MPRRSKRLPTIVRPEGPPQVTSDTSMFGVDLLPLNFQAVQHAARYPPQPWQDLPHPTGPPPFRLTLETVLTPATIQKITAAGKLTFHVLGDTGGVNENTDQENVASFLENDMETGQASARPAFFYHLGDVVYYAGQGKNYYSQFYEPYLRYPAPILAIPGNHDGDVDPTTGEKSLDAFVRNFCSAVPVHSPDAKDAPRKTMTQPNVYWTLETPFVTILGLYSNCPEGGRIHADQATWLASELKAAASEKALLVAVHHPIYSAFGPHPGSPHLTSILEEACNKAKRVPDAVLSGHVHNYQRFSGELAGKRIPFFVVGAGGYNHRLHTLSSKIHNARLPIAMPGSAATLENYCDRKHGFMKVTVTRTKMTFSYFAVPDPNASQKKPLRPFDSITLPIGGTGF